MTPINFREFVAIMLDVDLNDVEKVWEALRRRNLIGGERDAHVTTKDCASLLAGLCIAMTGGSGNISAEAAIFHEQKIIEAWANKKPYRYEARHFEAPLTVDVTIKASPLAKVFSESMP